MEKQNITLSLPRDLLRRVKHLAIEKETSVSALLAKTLEELVLSENRYLEARERQKALMRKGFNLSTQGKITWDRDELHER